MVFEEISEMAGALSHICAIVPVNISGLTRAIVKFQKDILQCQEKYKCLKLAIGYQFDYIEHFHLWVYNLLDHSITDTDDMLQTIASLQSSLLQVAEGAHPPLFCQRILTQEEVSLCHRQWHFWDSNGMVHPQAPKQFERPIKSSSRPAKLLTSNSNCTTASH
jgi:hypothetical protein